MSPTTKENSTSPKKDSELKTNLRPPRKIEDTKKLNETDKQLIQVIENFIK